MFSKKIVIHGEDFLIDGSLLGSGSQGEVFKIIHIKTGIVYAVKIVRVENASAKESMAHEIDILKSISSPYIISILPFSIISERFSYMIMDYCEAGDLKQHYRMINKGGGVSQNQVKKLIFDCTQGYKQLERHKILHMDIKLQNILMKAGNYALADFGLAINMNSDNHRYGGSLLYLSPQRFIKGSQISSLDDMFAFGIVVCEFANKLNHPYYGKQVLKGTGNKETESLMGFLFRQMTSANPVLPTGLHPELLEIIKKMIERKDSSRLTWRQLEEIVDHSAIFSDVREAANSQRIHLVMPIPEENFNPYDQKQLRETCVKIELLNSRFSLEQPKAVQAVYDYIREVLRSRLSVCIFLARVFDVIQAYNAKDDSGMFKDIQSSMLSIMEQLIDMESLSTLKIPGLSNAPECIEIQISLIQEEFDLILAIKNKITLMRQYFKMQALCSGICTELAYEVHRFELKVGDMLQRIEVCSNVKEIREDHTVRTSLFKLVLYLLNQVGRVMQETDWKLQSKLIPELGKYDLELKNYGNTQLAKAVSRYIVEDGEFLINLTYDEGCYEILDDELELEEANVIRLNTAGKYPPLY